MLILEQDSQRLVIVLNHQRLIQVAQLRDIQGPQLADADMLNAGIEVRNRVCPRIRAATGTPIRAERSKQIFMAAIFLAIRSFLSRAWNNSTFLEFASFASTLVLTVGAVIEYWEKIKNLALLGAKWILRRATAFDRCMFRKILLHSIGPILVVFGIGGEMIFETQAFRVSNRETADLTKTAGDAKQSAIDAAKAATQAQALASGAKTKADDVGVEADQAQGKIAAVSTRADLLNRQETQLSQLANALEKSVSVRTPTTVSPKIREAIAAMKDGVFHVQVATGDDEAMLAAISIELKYFNINARTRLKNWTWDGVLEPIRGGEATLLEQALLGPFGLGMDIGCGIPRSGTPSDRYKDCLEVRDALESDLIDSGIAAVRTETPDVPEGDILIRVWPKPTFDETQRIIKAQKARRARDK
jgi:hypothetical protein